MDIDFYYAIGVFAIGEIIANLVFSFFRKAFGFNGSEKSETLRMILIGVLERLTLFFSILLHIESVFVLFGALKVATRLQADGTKKTNDYFLIGNLVSVLFSIGYFIVYIFTKDFFY